MKYDAATLGDWNPTFRKNGCAHVQGSKLLRTNLAIYVPNIKLKFLLSLPPGVVWSTSSVILFWSIGYRTACVL